jgi:hypothetical protein
MLFDKFVGENECTKGFHLSKEMESLSNGFDFRFQSFNAISQQQLQCCPYQNCCLKHLFKRLDR